MNFWEKKKVKEFLRRCGRKKSDSPVPNISTLAVLKEDHPQMPVRNPQNEFPGVPLDRPFSWYSI